MKVDELEKIINNAFEDKQNISDTSDKKILDAINKTIDLTDKGSIRVAEKKSGKCHRRRVRCEIRTKTPRWHEEQSKDRIIIPM